MEQIITQVQQQIDKHRGVQSNLNDEMDNYIKGLVKTQKWPFETVTPDEYLSVARPLMETIYNAYSGRVDGKEVAPAVLYDSVSHATGEWIDCIQKMRLELVSQEVQEWALEARDLPFEDRAYYTEQVLDKLTEIGYSANQRVLEYMEPFLKEAGITPIFAGKENERIYNLQQEEARALKIRDNYKQTAESVAANKEQIIKYGVPPETMLGKFVDLVAGHGDEKEKNRELAVGFLACHMDADYLKRYIIPNLQIQAIKIQAMAALEDAKIEKAGLEGYSSYWEDYYKYEKGIANLEKIAIEIDKITADLKNQHSIELQAKEDGTYTLTLKEEKGDRHKDSYEQDGVKYSETIERGIKTRQRTIDLSALGELAQELRNAKKTYGKTQITEIPTQNPQKQNERIVKTKEKAIGERSTTRTNTFKLQGKRTSRLELKASVARLEHRVIKRSDFGYKTLDEQVRKNKLEIGKGVISGEVPTISRVGTGEVNLTVTGIQDTLTFGDDALTIDTKGAVVSAGVGTLIDTRESGKKVALALLEDLQNPDMALTRAVERLETAAQGLVQAPSVKLAQVSVSTSQIGLISVDAKPHVAEQENTTLETEQKGPIDVKVSSQLIDGVKKTVEQATTHAKHIPDALQQARETAKNLYRYDYHTPQVPIRDNTSHAHRDITQTQAYEPNELTL